MHDMPRQRQADNDLFAALLVGIADTFVTLVGRLSSKAIGTDHVVLAQVRGDKHPSRGHPIPNAAYDISVDEAAIAVDMRMPYQVELKHRVAAGPSDMRNYRQGCLPGLFNRLFASAKLVAYAKKLGSGGAPDVRHVAIIGEAEQRAAERAVVDNMKEA
eukprot:jgi/Tetstr1/426707/TSEL_016977.t1